MPWRGYNFEDAIVLSERLVKDDVNSLFIAMRWSLKSGYKAREEGVNSRFRTKEDATRDLDENGIIRIGARVSEGDILIGVTLKVKLTLHQKKSFFVTLW